MARRTLRAMRPIAPWFGLTEAAGGSEVVVLGCPGEDPAALRRGTAQAPGAVRRWARTAEAVTEEGRPVQGLRVVDLGDVETAAPAEERWRRIEAAARGAWAAHPGAFLLGLGGDHGVTPPLAAAARAVHGPLGLLVLDAHPDGFDSYQGDPLSHACTLRRLWDRAGYEPAATCLLGLRSYAPVELPSLAGAGLVVSARRWQRLAAGELAGQVQQATGSRPLYVSLDIDVLDPAFAPGTAYPVAGGPSVRQLLELLAAVWERQPVVAMDLVEVAPPLDPSGVTAAAAAQILLQVLGYVAARLG